MPQLANATIKEQRDPAFRFRGQSITYNTVTAIALTLTTGTVADASVATVIGSGTDSDPGVLTSTVSDRQIAASGNKYQVGDRLFMIRDSDMPETPPNTKSTITYDGGTYNIIGHDKSPDGNVWIVQGRLP